MATLQKTSTLRDPSVTPVERKRLTPLAIEKAPSPASGRREIYDTLVPQLALRITKSGSKSFVLRTRIGGQQVRLTLGRYPIIGLQEAREAARDALLKAQRGVDVRQEEKERHRQAALDQANSFASVVDTFLERYAKRRGNRSWPETKRIFDKYVIPSWGDRPIADIKRRDVVELLDRIEDRNGVYMANRTLAAVRKLFNWALTERAILEVTPIVPGMSRGKEVRRERHLCEEEVAAIWSATEAKGYPFGPLTKLLLVTGQRRSEVARMRWQDVDIDDAVWIIPPELTKPGRQHEVPLSDLALKILSTLPRVHDDLVFTTTGNSTVSGFSRAKEDLAGLAGFSDWRFHDLRATVATMMEERLGLPPHIIGSVLNHDPKRHRGVTGVYTRGTLIDERRRALDAWAEFLTELVKDGSSGTHNSAAAP